MLLDEAFESPLSWYGLGKGAVPSRDCQGMFLNFEAKGSRRVGNSAYSCRKVARSGKSHDWKLLHEQLSDRDD